MILIDNETPTKMSDRRRWQAVETAKLVELVEKNYDFLTAACNPSKTREMIDRKWDEVARHINSLGVGTSILTSDQVQKKWFDLKSQTKKAVVKYNGGIGRTGSGANIVKEPTELQYRIASFIGKICTEGVPGAADCDTSKPPTVGICSDSFLADSFPWENEVSIPCASSSPNEKCDPPTSKRPRMSKKDEQTAQILEAERSIVDTVKGMREELKSTNSLIGEVVQEMKRSNDIHQQLLDILKVSIPQRQFIDMFNSSNNLY